MTKQDCSGNANASTGLHMLHAVVINTCYT